MVEPLDPKKYHVMPENLKKKLLIIGSVFVLVVAPILGYIYYNIAINRPSQLDTEVNFEIKRGEGIAEIAKNLHQKNAVNSEFLFSFYVFLNKLDTNIQAGSYVLRAGTPLVGLVEQFQHGVNDTRITFLEGWRVEEYARVANAQFEKIDYNEFVKKAAPYEGYLFPDTYYFETDVREDDMITRLRENFDTQTADLLTPAKLQRSGLTKEQVVILASIVEREVNTEEDRPIVAGLLLARFREGMSLGADATTQYAVAPGILCGNDAATTGMCATPLEEINDFNWWPKNLTQENLDFDSPYNTRKVAGLPPRPISNPSLSAIDAVVNFKETNYVYYLTDNYGVTHYAVTLDEHNANIAKYLQ
jgi:UPF0755 protein